MNRFCQLSIVIPAYNEGDRLAPTLRTVVAWAQEYLDSFEIIVVDDGSQDNTVAVAQQFAPEVVVVSNGTNRGKGYSVRHGVMRSQGELILFSDADLSTPIGEYFHLATALDGHDIAIGSRALDASEITQHQPFYREAMGKIFNKIVQGLTVRGIEDTQCGFKLFKGDIARELFADMTIFGFAFDVEILYSAQQRGYRIAEVPVKWANDERTTVHAVRDAARMFRDVVRIRMNQVKRRQI